MLTFGGTGPLIMTKKALYQFITHQTYCNKIAVYQVTDKQTLTNNEIALHQVKLIGHTATYKNVPNNNFSIYTIHMYEVRIQSTKYSVHKFESSSSGK